MKSTANFVLGLLLGAAVGGVLALLFAPMPGEQLRVEAKDRANQFATDVKSAVEEERKRLESELASLKRGEIQVA